MLFCFYLSLYLLKLGLWGNLSGKPKISSSTNEQLLYMKSTFYGFHICTFFRRFTHFFYSLKDIGFLKTISYVSIKKSGLPCHAWLRFMYFYLQKIQINLNKIKAFITAGWIYGCDSLLCGPEWGIMKTGSLSEFLFETSRISSQIYHATVPLHKIKQFRIKNFWTKQFRFSFSALVPNTSHSS